MRAGEVDYSPLARRPIDQELDLVRAEALAGAFGEPTAEQARTATTRGRTLLLIVGGFITAVLAVTTLVQWLRGEDAGDTVVGLGVTAFVAGACLAVYALVRRVIEPAAWRRQVRMILFSRSNGFTIEPAAGERILPGTLGERPGRRGSVSDRMTWEQDGMPVEFGVYRQASSGARGSAFVSPYLTVRLRRPLPRMTFVSRTAVAVTPSVSFGVDVLPDDYPHQGKRRVRLVTATADAELARRVFTDELIHALAHPVYPANAEVRGDWLLIYPRTGRSIVDEQWWRHTLASVELAIASVRAAAAPGPDPAAWELYPR